MVSGILPVVGVPLPLLSFGGTSILIIVSVGLDTVQQLQSHLLAHQYEGLIEKSQLRGRKSKTRSGSGRKGPARR